MSQIYQKYVHLVAKVPLNLYNMSLMPIIVPYTVLLKEKHLNVIKDGGGCFKRLKLGLARDFILV